MAASIIVFRKHTFIPALCTVLILLIGFKVLAPVFKMTRMMIKELSLTAGEVDTDKTEKKSDNESLDKKEYFNTTNNVLTKVFSSRQLVHNSAYSMDYISSHYYQITTPPPDFSLLNQS